MSQHHIRNQREHQDRLKSPRPRAPQADPKQGQVHELNSHRSDLLTPRRAEKPESSALSDEHLRRDDRIANGLFPRRPIENAVQLDIGCAGMLRVDFRDCRTAEEANAKLAWLGIHEPQPSAGEAMVKAFELTVEATLIQPTLVFGHPVEISPLAKPMAEDPRYVERFEIFIAGMECGDNWSEQNDPAHLLETFRKAYRAEERDTGKFHTMDYDFIEALEYGMPPTTGIGPGVERMAMIFTEQENIDDVIFFPMMRPSVSALNAAIYQVAEAEVAPVEDAALSWAVHRGRAPTARPQPGGASAPAAFGRGGGHGTDRGGRLPAQQRAASGWI